MRDPEGLKAKLLYLFVTIAISYLVRLFFHGVSTGSFMLRNLLKKIKKNNNL
ncbi:DUF1146 domain-containing protein [Sinobaca sp. H24]|uniref:DUF1146 domain-containing protein n=1 Tax=Sinobaca sp. H24 TaxID=2923376 RepID=UPI00207AC69D|nr:DUF1146 domain-containing protein [Sinobaca sp. H24]